MAIKTTGRINRSTKIAYWAEIQRIYYTATLTAFVHSWCAIILSLLIPSAMTVLQFLAALNRCSKHGYIGCAVAYSLLAPRIAQTTGRTKFSVRSLERGIAWLKKLGLVDLTWYTIPDRTIRNGQHEHTIRGTERVNTRDGWRSLQIRIITLTDRATAMWDRRTEHKGCDYIPHFVQFSTPANLAASLPIDLVGKPTNIDRELSEHGSSRTDRETVFDYEQTGDGDVTKTSNDLTRSTTSPNEQIDDRTTARSDVKHQSSNVSVSMNDTAPSDSKPIKSNEDTGIDHNSNQTSHSSGIDSDENVDRQKIKRNTDSHKPQSDVDATSHRPSHHTEIATVGHLRGVGCTRPIIPKNAKNKTSWAVARVYLLAELHSALERHSRLEADAIYDRAKIELSRVYPSRFASVPWEYWVGRFALMLPPQRRYHMYRDILPVLKGRAVVPTEPHRITLDRTISAIGDELDPFLRRFKKMFLDEE